MQSGRKLRDVLSAIFIIVLSSCGEKKNTLFTKLGEGQTNIDFRNLVLENNEQFSCLNFPYYYNGGGVAAGDFNNDGLQDLVFTGSMVKNRLFINKGNFKFEDVTIHAGIAKYEGWCTGVSVADVNQDGWLDIYICRSAFDNPSFRTNLLFINNHDLSFTEQAAQYGLNDSGYSTQASFFDYDKDGDLDLFLIKQSKPEYSRGGYTDFSSQRNQPADPQFENKLFRNDGAHFTDVTHQAGISSKTQTFSLGLVTADINMDGWPDIYVSNDYNEADYVYINNKDGTFTDELKDRLDHVALYSMGCDIADYNNDVLPDICTLDMLPESNYDLKMHSSAERFDKYQQFLSYGFYPFFMRNQLQKNNGDGSFSEIGRLAGIAATNWSWSVLFGDYDLDGKKDIFITNGVKRDITNLEYMRFASNNAQRVRQGGAPIAFTDFLTHIPGEISAPYLYKNTGNDVFQNLTAEYGLDEAMVSNGAIYTDLDNDGDLDLVSNNIDQYASVYRNNAEKLYPGNHFIQFSFAGTSANPMGLGAKVFIYCKNKIIYQEQLLTRGFQSGVDPRITAGLGNETQIDSVRIIWPNDNYQVLYNVKVNQSIKLEYSKANMKFDYRSLLPRNPPLLTEINSTIQYQHKENHENDFNTQTLLPHFYSHNGPCMAVGDINGDGRTDLFIGGAKGSEGSIFVQQPNNTYSALPVSLFKDDKNCEDVAAVFFDADNDKDLDLYVVSGGYEFEKDSPGLQDRLYINDGKGNFAFRPLALPETHQNKTCVAVYDINNDGYTDIFVGGGVIKGAYPFAAPGHILLNDGKGNFTDRTKEICPELLTMTGIVNSAAWLDINKDGRKDLVLAGEWMPVKAFINDGKILSADAHHAGLVPEGWGSALAVADLDGDGDEDIIAGNWGLNTPFKADTMSPVRIYYSDIDGDKVIDPLISVDNAGKQFPFIGMDDATMQVPSLRKKFYEYPIYAKAEIQDLYPTGTNLKKIPQMEIDELRSVYLENTGSGFIIHPLPVEAQYAPVFAISVADYNHDGNKDILLLGNNKYNRLRIGKLDANHGVLLAGNGKGGFEYLPQYSSGLKLRDDIRSAVFINNTLIIGVNDGAVKMYHLN